MAEAERARLLASVSSVDMQIAAIQGLLEIESQRSGANGHVQRAPKLAIEDFLVELARRGAISKEGMTAAAKAEGYPVNGRHIHGYLMKLLRDGALAMTKEGIVAK